MKQVLLALLIFAVLVLAFFGLHEYATEQRGYEAIGGEIFVFALPLLYFAIKKNVKDTVDIFRDGSFGNDSDNEE